MKENRFIFLKNNYDITIWHYAIHYSKWSISLFRLDIFTRSWKMHLTNLLIHRNMHISRMKISRISARILPLNLGRLCSLLQPRKELLWKPHYLNLKSNMNTHISFIWTAKMEKWRCFCAQMKQSNKKSRKLSNPNRKCVSQQ